MILVTNCFMTRHCVPWLEEVSSHPTHDDKILIDIDVEMLTRCIDAHLRLDPTLEDNRYTNYMLVNIFTHLSGGVALPPKNEFWDLQVMLPLG